jgi:hypothetical protein
MRKETGQIRRPMAECKKILGWILDVTNHTICLPPEKVTKITKHICLTLKQNKVHLNNFQKLAGTLHHTAYGMPGGRGLFNLLWKAMAQCTNRWVKVSTEIRNILNDFKWLFAEIANKPINVTQLVPTLPNLHGYCDACKWGAGGVWILPHNKNNNRHVMWTVPFPTTIIEQFDKNKLSINDLEMAGILMQ